MADRKTSPVYTARGSVEGEDWSAVAMALNRRMAARRVGQQELAELSRVSVSTLRQVQHGAGRRVQNKTLTAISRALGWPDEHLTQVLMSDQQHPAQPSDDGDPVLAALHRVEQQLRELNQRLSGIETIVRNQSGEDEFDGDCTRG
jgi:DNA-binding Xre family transcriptional regulator